MARKAAETPPAPESLSATHAARILGISPRRVRQLAEEGRLSTVATDPLRLSKVEVLALREKRETEAATRPELPPAPLRLAPTELLEALTQARQAGAEEARNALEAVSNEVRERAERAEQRATQAEAARLVAESQAAALQARLEVIEEQLAESKTRRGFFRR